MNREQAIKAVADKIGLSRPFTDNLVDAMAAVGVLKLDDPSLRFSLRCGHGAEAQMTIMSRTSDRCIRAGRRLAGGSS